MKMLTSSATKEKSGLSSDNFSVGCLCRWVPLISGIVVYLMFILFFNPPNCPASEFFPEVKLTCAVQQPAQSPNSNDDDSPTNLSHLVFGLVGSERAWHHRKDYIGSWWRPNVTKGYLYLDEAPKGNLLPWSEASPPYRVSDDISKMLQERKAVEPVAKRIVHGIMEAFREELNGDFRWLVMGDDDSIFFVDNMVDVLSKYDHRNYYYFGGQSEFINSNFWYSFNQGFGGAGFILSYPLAKALAKDMENCLTRYAKVKAADTITMSCIADIGVNLSPHKGIHQIDLHGDLSGFLSAHPQAPLISLHHFDATEPIFPFKNRFGSARHLMKAASLDQSRMLQQTICYKRQSNWSFSISWGYSVHIYEKIMPRSWLQRPIETFKAWIKNPRPPRYMFDTRWPSNNDPCEAPHVFYFHSIKKTSSDEILTVYSRASPRGLPACSSSNGNQSAEIISTIEIYSPATKRVESGRCECCDIVHEDGTKTATVKYRQCLTDEIIA